MNDQDMRLRTLEMTVEMVKHKEQLLGAAVVDEAAFFKMAEHMFNYVWSGDHPDQESNGGNDGEKNN